MAQVCQPGAAAVVANAALLPLLAKIDARRPASWLAGGLGAAVALLPAASGGRAGVAAAVAGGGWAAVAAIGRPPRGLVPGAATVDAAWWWERGAWPVVGGGLGAVIRHLLQGETGVETGVTFAALAFGAGLATAVGAAAARRGAAAADAASLGLVSATAAAAGAWAGRYTAPLPAGVATGCGLAALAWIGWRAGLGQARWDGADARGGSIRLADIALAGGGLRAVLSALAMAASLVGMAACHFLVPETAPTGLVAAVALFAALVIPAAVIGPPTTAAWRPLAAAAAGPAPNPIRWATAVAAGHAAVLGWPPLVAGLVHGAEHIGIGGGWPWPWLTVAALASAAGMVAGLVRAASWARVSADATLAVASALVVGLACGATFLPLG